MQNKTIILLSDIIESKVRKEKELEFYNKQLVEITTNIQRLNNDLNLTQLIIDMIENDGIKELSHYMKTIKKIP
tara:strand:+ start:92 stop:313 length:222 start_codon:yes stop_codon:yes gene_type:complete